MLQTMKILTILLATTMQFYAWSQGWVESYKDNSVSIEYSKITHLSQSDGINHERFIFKYSNLTNEELSIEFDRKIAYNGVELSSSPERKYSITIPANSILEYSDDEKFNKLCYIFVSDNKGTIKSRLSGFEITNIEIKENEK